jgi:hypothetical protein
VLILIAQNLIFEAAFTFETIVVAWTWVVIVINRGFPCFVNVIGCINIRSSASLRVIDRALSTFPARMLIASTQYGLVYQDSVINRCVIADTLI